MTVGLLASGAGSAQCLLGADDLVLTNGRATAVVVGVRGESVHVPFQSDETRTGPSSGPGGTLAASVSPVASGSVSSGGGGEALAGRGLGAGRDRDGRGVERQRPGRCDGGATCCGQ